MIKRSKFIKKTSLTNQNLKKSAEREINLGLEIINGHNEFNLLKKIKDEK